MWPEEYLEIGSHGEELTFYRQVNGAIRVSWTMDGVFTECVISDTTRVQLVDFLRRGE